MITLLICYLGVHSYRGWADTRRLRASRSSLDDAYAAISGKLGQPDDSKTTNTCQQQNGLAQTYTICSVETDFVYSVANQTQANLFMNQIQKVMSIQKGFKATKKVSKQLSDTLLVDSYAHEATDYYRGPYGSTCQIKYVFATSDDITLSARDPSMQPFEIFFKCSHKSVRSIYPS